METFGAIDPEAIACSRPEDSERLVSMCAVSPDQWTDRDVDLVMFRAMTTIMSPEVVPWALAEFLRRAISNPAGGWTTDGDVVRQKLEASQFGEWPAEAQDEVLALLPAYIAAPDTYSESLAAWLQAFSRKDA